MKLNIQTVIPLLLFAFLLAACGTKAQSELVVSYGTEHPANFSEIKQFYLAKNMEKLNFSASLQMQGYELEILVEDTTNGDIVWMGSFAGSCDFKIDLTNVKANTDYVMHVNATECSEVNLRIIPEGKLYEDINTPGRYLYKR